MQEGKKIVGPIAKIPNQVIDLRTMAGNKVYAPPETREERRRREKLGRKFEARQTFSRKEYMTAVEESYQVAVTLTLQAAKQVLGLGPSRLERVLQQLVQEETRVFGQPVRNYQLDYQDEGKKKK